VKPPIIPNLQDSYIDSDYTDLPLDFEEAFYKARMSTERRYSYYYESTLMTKSILDQSFFNKFFDNKIDTGSGNSIILGGFGSSIRDSVFHPNGNLIGLSIKSDDSLINGELPKVQIQT
jgi:hypothetical protein